MKLDRSIKPEPQHEQLFKIPEFNIFTLNNGIKVYYSEKHNLPIIRLTLLNNSGSKFDLAGKNGTANLFNMMLDEGAGQYGPLELSDEFEFLGSSFDSSCNSDAIYLTIRTLTENFNKTLFLLKEILTSPHLKEDDFEREKRKIIVRLLQSKDDSEEIANNIVEYLMFDKKHPYSFPLYGDENSVKNIQVDDIRNYYNQYFKTDVSSIVAVGDFNPFELKEELNNTIGTWITGDSVQKQFLLPAELTIPKIYFFHKDDAVQSDIRIGHRTDKRNEKTYLTKLILNLILGGQFTSRINLNLREDKGYTYGAFSSFYYFKDSGYFLTSTSTASKNTANVIKETLFELDNIKNGVKPEELELAKSSLIKKFPQNFETIRNISTSLARLILFNLPINHFDSYLDRLNDVKLDDINEAAKKELDKDKCFVVVVGDKKILKNELEGLNGFELVEVNEFGDII